MNTSLFEELQVAYDILNITKEIQMQIECEKAGISDMKDEMKVRTTSISSAIAFLVYVFSLMMTFTLILMIVAYEFPNGSVGKDHILTLVFLIVTTSILYLVWKRFNSKDKRKLNARLTELSKAILNSEFKIESLKEQQATIEYQNADALQVLPEFYRNEKDARMILDLVKNKRADTLKEAINLYEELLYRSRIEKNQTHQNNEQLFYKDETNILYEEQGQKPIGIVGQFVKSILSFVYDLVKFLLSFNK